MKKILVLLILVQIQVALAGLPEFIVSPRDSIPYPGENTPVLTLPIYEWQNSYFLVRYASCWPPVLGPKDHEVVVNGTDIQVFRHKQPVALKCTPLPPPSYYELAQIPGLANGTYNLNYYSIPDNVPYPPDDADLPNYLAYNLSFNVLAVRSINSLSTWSLGGLTLLLFITGFTGLKMQRRNKFIN